jgi:hypothetical protein
MYEIQNLVYLEALEEEKERELAWRRLQARQVAQLPQASPPKKVSPWAVRWMELTGVLRICLGVAYGLVHYKP